MSWSPTLFSGSGPVGLPPVPWTEKKIERAQVRARTYQHPCTNSCDWQKSFWINENLKNMCLILQQHYVYEEEKRLRWSMGSVLASSAQVRVFKPGRSHRNFQGEKIPSTPSFGGEVKPAVPCRRFAACTRKRSLNGTWKSAFRQNSRLLFLAR
jgi:hypothetical protein